MARKSRAPRRIVCAFPHCAVERPLRPEEDVALPKNKAPTPPPAPRADNPVAGSSSESPILIAEDESEEASPAVGSSSDSPILIAEDESEEEEWHSAQQHASGERSIVTKRGRSVSSEYETPSKRRVQVAAPTQAPLAPNPTAVDTGDVSKDPDDGELLVYQGGQLVRFPEFMFSPADNPGGRTSKPSRTLSSEPAKSFLSAARMQIFERTFRAVVFPDMVSIQNVMVGVNGWVKKSAGEGTFTFAEGKAALEALSARKVLHLAGDTVFLPEKMPLTTEAGPASH